MAVKKTQKILEELELLGLANDSVASIEKEKREIIKAYWGDKKIQKQLLIDISKEDYQEGIFLMFRVFFQEDEDSAKALIAKIGKDFSKPQGVVKNLLEKKDDEFSDLLSSEILYHAVYFAQQYSLSEETLNSLFENNENLLPALNEAVNSFKNKAKQFFLQFWIVQKIFSALNINLPPDFTAKEMQRFEVQVEDGQSNEEYSQRQEGSAITEDQVRKDSVDRSSVKVKEPFEDRGVGQDNSHSGQGDCGDLNFSSIQPNVSKLKKEGLVRDMLSPVKVIPFHLEHEARVQREQEESSEEFFSQHVSTAKSAVEVIPFKLPEDSSSDASTPTNPYQMLVARAPDSFPRMTQGSAQKLTSPSASVDLAHYYRSPTVNKSSQSNQQSSTNKPLAAIQHPRLRDTSLSTTQNPSGLNSAEPFDLSKFYQSTNSVQASSKSLEKDDPVIALIMSPARPVPAPKTHISAMRDVAESSDESSVIEEKSTNQKIAAPVDELLASVSASKPKPFSLLDALHSSSEISTPTQPNKRFDYSGDFELKGHNASGFYTPNAEDQFLGADGDDFYGSSGEEEDDHSDLPEDDGIPNLLEIDPNESQEIEAPGGKDDYEGVPNLRKVNHFESQDLSDDEEDDLGPLVI